MRARTARVARARGIQPIHVDHQVIHHHLEVRDSGYQFTPERHDGLIAAAHAAGNGRGALEAFLEIEIHAAVARRQLPGAEAAVARERHHRPRILERARDRVVAAALAGEYPAALQVVAREVRIGQRRRRAALDVEPEVFAL